MKQKKWSMSIRSLSKIWRKEKHNEALKNYLFNYFYSISIFFISSLILQSYSIDFMFLINNKSFCEANSKDVIRSASVWERNTFFQNKPSKKAGYSKRQKEVTGVYWGRGAESARNHPIGFERFPILIRIQQRVTKHERRGKSASNERYKGKQIKRDLFYWEVRDKRIEHFKKEIRARKPIKIINAQSAISPQLNAHWPSIYADYAGL